ncbi:DUF1653 domain-containing protein [uncultured Roseobacter sp.]|uniref:DUF1653 domain-containing protein n=1 Tax=uncultured Roseobacter sp. TaxID=114847 RepID=UPI0026016A19|nr:DUF1653 domain-containing protein [uncultured Roseobacter sp.]
MWGARRLLSSFWSAGSAIGKTPFATGSGGERAVWVATHLHRKGGLYRVLAHGILEADRSEVVIYDDVEGTIWVRPKSEFEDGRFSELAEPSPEAARSI